MHRLRRRFQPLLARVRRVRKRRWQARIYNDQRQRYHANSARKQVKSDLLVSIIVPAYNPPTAAFEQLISSIFAQSYPNWELIIADGSTEPSTRSFLQEKASSDTRIKYLGIKNKGIGGNTNAALAAAEGDIVAFLDHDDTLDPDALAYGVEQFELHPETGLVYSDEDKLSEDGEKFLDPHFKPDFSLDLLRNVNYITHFVMVRTIIAREVDGIRAGFEGAQDYDFLLRVVDTGTDIRHIPRILYHWRLSGTSTSADFSNKEFITNAGEKALMDHYERRGIKNVEVAAIKYRPGFYIAKYSLSKKRRAIIIVANKATPGGIPQFIEHKYRQNKSVTEDKIDVITVNDLNRADLSKYESVMIVRGTVIPGYKKSQITQMFAVAEQPGTYAVSPKLVSNGKVRDMGLVADENSGGLMPLFLGMEPDEPNVFGSLEWVRNVNALSGRVFVMSGDALDALAARKDKSLARVIVPEGTTDKLVVWAHIEMLLLDDSTDHYSPKKTQEAYYNSNLAHTGVPTSRNSIDVVEFMMAPDGDENG